MLMRSYQWVPNTVREWKTWSSGYCQNFPSAQLTIQRYSQCQVLGSRLFFYFWEVNFCSSCLIYASLLSWFIWLVRLEIAERYEYLNTNWPVGTMWVMDYKNRYMQVTSINSEDNSITVWLWRNCSLSMCGKFHAQYPSEITTFKYPTLLFSCLKFEQRG